MADEKLYRYTANKDPNSSVDTVTLSEDGEKVVHLGGGPVWLTDEEAANATSIVLEEADDDEGAPPTSRRDADSGDSVDPVVEAGEKAVDPDSLQDGEVERNTDGTPVVPDGTGAGGVVDPEPAAGTSSGYIGSGSRGSDGQGSRGASGQDVGTTTGGVG